MFHSPNSICDADSICVFQNNPFDELISKITFLSLCYFVTPDVRILEPWMMMGVDGGRRENV